MEFEEITEKIDFISKNRIKNIAPDSPAELARIIEKARPTSWREKIILGYLTSLAAEYSHPQPLKIKRKDLDYLGIEMETGTLRVGGAGIGTGTTMKGGTIVVQGKTGSETGKGMQGGKIHAEEIESIANTLGGKIITKKAGKIDKHQGAEIYINGKKYKKTIRDRIPFF